LISFIAAFFARSDAYLVVVGGRGKEKFVDSFDGGFGGMICLRRAHDAEYKYKRGREAES
jgi:hypothetical protein